MRWLNVSMNCLPISNFVTKTEIENKPFCSQLTSISRIQDLKTDQDLDMERNQSKKKQKKKKKKKNSLFFYKNIIRL